MGRSFTKGFSGPKSLRDFRETGPWTVDPDVGLGLCIKAPVVNELGLSFSNEVPQECIYEIIRVVNSFDKNYLAVTCNVFFNYGKISFLFPNKCEMVECGRPFKKPGLDSGADRIGLPIGWY